MDNFEGFGILAWKVLEINGVHPIPRPPSGAKFEITSRPCQFVHYLLRCRQIFEYPVSFLISMMPSMAKWELVYHIKRSPVFEPGLEIEVYRPGGSMEEVKYLFEFRLVLPDSIVLAILRLDQLRQPMVAHHLVHALGVHLCLHARLCAVEIMKWLCAHVSYLNLRNNPIIK
jgi:hypothetical protein